MSRGAFKLRDTTYSQGYAPGYSQDWYTGYKAAVIENLPGGIVYGAYIVVYIASVYALLSKPGFTSSPRRRFLFGTTTFMFVLGIIVLVLSTTLWTLEAYNSNVYLTDNTILITISSLMWITCDSICAWRTATVWKNDKRVIAILVFFILVSAGVAVGNVCIQENLLSGNLYFVLFAGLSLATNLLSTGLIAWKAWQRRIPVRVHLCDGSGFLRFERVYALLIESGFIYCCIWIIYVILLVHNVSNLNFTLIVFVSGLYPTLIIILISKQMSPVEHYLIDSTHSTEML